MIGVSGGGFLGATVLEKAVSEVVCFKLVVGGGTTAAVGGFGVGDFAGLRLRLDCRSRGDMGSSFWEEGEEVVFGGVAGGEERGESSTGIFEVGCLISCSLG